MGAGYNLAGAFVQRRAGWLGCSPSGDHPLWCIPRSSGGQAFGPGRSSGLGSPSRDLLVAGGSHSRARDGNELISHCGCATGHLHTCSKVRQAQDPDPGHSCRFGTLACFGRTSPGCCPDRGLGCRGSYSLDRAAVWLGRPQAARFLRGVVIREDFWKPRRSACWYGPEVG